MITMSKILKATLAASVLAIAGGLASAEDTNPVKSDLGHYYPIRAALAGDKTEGVKEHADGLAASADKAVAKAAKTLAAAQDLAAARKAFGDVTKALLAGVEKAAKAGTDLGAVYVFECPMAKPYGRWMQAEADLGNPYYGSKMLTCGKQIATFGAAEKKEEGKDDHGGHKHGGH